MSHEWLLNLKEDDTVVVNSTTFEPIEKQFDRYAQTKAGRGFQSEKTIILKNCGTRFHLNGRGKGSLSHRNKWLTEPKETA